MKMLRIYSFIIIFFCLFSSSYRVRSFIINEIDNKQKEIDDFIELFIYKLLGYSKFIETNQNNMLDLQVVEYNPNLNENIKEIVEKGENIINISEKNEYKKTGYIKQVQLILLSNFLTDYTE